MANKKEIKIKGFQVFGSLPEGCEFTVVCSPIGNGRTIEAFVQCKCGWTARHDFEREHSSLYHLELAIKADMKEHGGIVKDAEQNGETAQVHGSGTGTQAQGPANKD